MDVLPSIEEVHMHVWFALWSLAVALAAEPEAQPEFAVDPVIGLVGEARPLVAAAPVETDPRIVRVYHLGDRLATPPPELTRAMMRTFQTAERRIKAPPPPTVVPSLISALPIGRGLSGIGALHSELGPGLSVGGEALTWTLDGARWDGR